MARAKRLCRWLLVALAPFAVYLLAALVLSVIPVNRNSAGEVPPDETTTVYLATNGVHLDIVLPLATINPALLDGLVHDEHDRYLPFGWGDENFYLNTPTWGDLTFANASRAMLLRSPTLVHVTRYPQRGTSWTEVAVSAEQLRDLQHFIQRAFVTQDTGKVLLPDSGYTPRDDFYRAHGSYSCLYTCNTWVNDGFKQSGLRACAWTPFDFPLLAHHSP